MTVVNRPDQAEVEFLFQGCSFILNHSGTGFTEVFLFQGCSSFILNHSGTGFTEVFLFANSTIIKFKKRFLYTPKF